MGLEKFAEEDGGMIVSRQLSVVSRPTNSLDSDN